MTLSGSSIPVMFTSHHAKPADLLECLPLPLPVERFAGATRSKSRSFGLRGGPSAIMTRPLAIRRRYGAMTNARIAV